MLFLLRCTYKITIRFFKIDELVIYFVNYREPNEQSVYVDLDTRIQILETMLELPNAEREQCAAFIVSPNN